MRRLVPTLVAAGLVLAGCGGSTKTVISTPSTPAPAPTTTTATATTTARAPASDRTAGPPGGGPVPAHFNPVAFTAISAQRFWLLGTAPCPHPICTSIVRTSDGGAHFVGIPAPVAPLAQSGGGSGISTLLFADPRDGFAGGAGYPEPRPLWETHDGGAHWARGRADVIAFTVTHGQIYAITGHCANGVCSQLHLARSAAGADSWSSVALPAASAAGLPSLTTWGSSVWISLTPTAGTPRKQTLYVSRDGGHTLLARSSACYPGLTATLQASSGAVAWAVCPTGMEAAAWRTADGGGHWTRIPGRPLPGLSGGLANSLRLAPASDRAVLMLPGGSEPAFLSTDGGQTFARAGLPTAGSTIAFAGFTDARTGSVLLGSAAGTNALWRSADGGVHWRQVRIGP